MDKKSNGGSNCCIGVSNVDSLDNQIITIKGGKIYLFFKRLFDIVLSFIAIILVSVTLIFPIISLLVLISTHGKVIFKDERMGLNRKKITIFKFQTMYSDAETNVDKYLTTEQKKSWDLERKVKNDPRVTKLGKFLRRTSLDELPQLFNIFMGTLSFVGPRPITEEELIKNFSTYQQEQLMKVKPGLTGYWQVMDRSEATYETGNRQQEELAYLPKRSFWFDLKIMFMTIPAVIKGKGAR